MVLRKKNQPQLKSLHIRLEGMDCCLWKFQVPTVLWGLQNVGATISVILIGCPNTFLDRWERPLECLGYNLSVFYNEGALTRFHYRPNVGRLRIEINKVSEMLRISHFNDICIL